MVEGALNLATLASVWILPVLFAVTLHEAAHGWAAWRLGDDTAKTRGRVSFNPLRHIDPIGTVLVPAVLLLVRFPILFGWAKPVPVNFGRLRHPKQDMVLVAAAGPAANLLLAFVAALGFHLVGQLPSPLSLWVAANLGNAFTLNIVLAVFNMLPLPPLDGGRVAVGLLPMALAVPLARLERYGLFILVGFLFVMPMLAGYMGVEVDPIGWILGSPVDLIGGVLRAAAGHG